MTSDISQYRQGVVLQDQVRLGPWRLRLRLRLGLQRARVPLYRETGILDVVGEPLLATNWDLGALVRLTEGMSVYAGSQYANAFDRQLYNTAIDTRYLPLHPGRSLALTAVYR